MKQLPHLVSITLVLMLFGCVSYKEQVMPFRNLEYTSDRGFPVKSSNSDFTFKASINVSTSVDRIITVSIDSTLGNKATLLEVFSLKKGKVKLKQTELFPKSGFADFKRKIDSLNLFSQKNQGEFALTLHQPFSLYVIEIKENEKYNQFRFNTYFPDKTKTSAEFEKLQRLIFSEFYFPMYTK